MPKLYETKSCETHFVVYAARHERAGAKWASSGLSCGMLSWKKHLRCFLPLWLDCTARSCRPLEQLSVASPWNVFAERTKNFSGAEIEGLVKSAASFALNRQVDVNDLSKKVDEDNIKVIQRPHTHSQRVTVITTQANLVHPAHH